LDEVRHFGIALALAIGEVSRRFDERHDFTNFCKARSAKPW